MPILALLMLLALPAQAADTFVSPSGSDAGDCIAMPCKTLRRAVDATGGDGTVRMAPGVYNDSVSIEHYKHIFVLGDCADPSKVVINVPSGAAGFWVQDHATAIVGCFTLNGGSGSAGIISRQFAIADYYNVRFGPFPGGTHVAAVEQSKTNCGGWVEIFGGAVVHGSATGMSTLLLPCTIILTGSPAIDYFYVGTGRSLIEAYTTIYMGGSVGMQFALQDSSLNMNNSIVPGNAKGLLYNDAKAY